MRRRGVRTARRIGCRRLTRVRLAACAQFGRRFLGWERDAAMAALAQRRLAGLRAVPVPGQIEMFG
jgi:hypothetical protein